MTLPIVIVGGGLAAVRTAQSLRASGYADAIVLIGEELHLPYDRPSLSKEVLGGMIEAPPMLAPDGWIASASIDARWGRRVTDINRSPLSVSLDDGTVVAAKAIVLATGARDRKLPVPGSDLPGVVGLRSLDDATQFKQLLSGVDHLIIAGGGLIGCEVASTARSLGVSVTVVEAGSGPLLRVLGPDLGAMVRGWLEEIGVNFRFSTTVDAIEGDGRVEAIRLSDGDTIPTELLLVSIGAEPRVELAIELGIGDREGVRVNGVGETEIPNIFAVGDIARWPLQCGGQRCLETYINTQDQAALVAGALMEQATPQSQRPYSWTTIAGRKIQIAGDIAGSGGIVFRDIPMGGKLAFRVESDGRIGAGAAIDAPKEYGLLKRLVDKAATADITRLADPSVPLRTLLQEQQGLA